MPHVMNVIYVLFHLYQSHIVDDGCTGYHACRRCSTRGFTGKFCDLEVFEQYVCVFGCESLIVIQHLFEIYVCACSASKSLLPRQTDQQLKRNEKSLFGIAVARTQTLHL